MTQTTVNTYAQQSKAAEFKIENQMNNRFYDKFHACKMSWFWGTVVGIPAAVLFSLLIAGFEFSATFWCLIPFNLVSCIWVISTVFALGKTADFGCSCIPHTIFRVVGAVWDFFGGTYVTLIFAAFLIGFVLVAWLVALFIFMAIFPHETVYYWIRYSIEKKIIKNRMERYL